MNVFFMDLLERLVRLLSVIIHIPKRTVLSAEEFSKKKKDVKRQTCRSHTFGSKTGCCIESGY